MDIRRAWQDNHLFDGSSRLVKTFTRAQLTADATGQRFSSPAGLAITLPAGLTSGPLVVGSRIDPDPLVPDANSFDQSGVQRGSDWESLNHRHAHPGERHQPQPGQRRRGLTVGRGGVQ